MPPYTVSGGHDSDGAAIYVGRSEHEGEILACKVIPDKGCAFLAWGGQEHPKYHYELLTGPGYGWVASGNGGTAPNAVVTGCTGDGEPMYIGRGHHCGSLTVGKVHASHGCLYIPYGGQEVRLTNYEVLVRQPTDTWVPTSMCNAPAGAVVAGHDSDGTVIYVSRSMHNGCMMPAKFIPNRSEAYVACEGNEIHKSNVEVLVGHNYTWVPVPHGIIPPNAVSTVSPHCGQPMYVGRVHHNGSLTPGLVLCENNCVLIPYGGREVSAAPYEVLIRT